LTYPRLTIRRAPVFACQPRSSTMRRGRFDTPRACKTHHALLSLVARLFLPPNATKKIQRGRIRQRTPATQPSRPGTPLRIRFTGTSRIFPDSVPGDLVDRDDLVPGRGAASSQPGIRPAGSRRRARRPAPPPRAAPRTAASSHRSRPGLGRRRARRRLSSDDQDRAVDLGGPHPDCRRG